MTGCWSVAYMQNKMGLKSKLSFVIYYVDDIWCIICFCFVLRSALNKVGLPIILSVISIISTYSLLHNREIDTWDEILIEYTDTDSSLYTYYYSYMYCNVYARFQFILHTINFYPHWPNGGEDFIRLPKVVISNILQVSSRFFLHG